MSLIKIRLSISKCYYEVLRKLAFINIVYFPGLYSDVLSLSQSPFECTLLHLFWVLGLVCISQTSTFSPLFNFSSYWLLKRPRQLKIHHILDFLTVFKNLTFRAPRGFEICSIYKYIKMKCIGSETKQFMYLKSPIRM